MTGSGRLDAAALVSLRNMVHRTGTGICVNSMRRAQPRGQDNGGHCRTLPVAPQTIIERDLSDCLVWPGHSHRLDAGCVTLKPGTGMDGVWTVWVADRVLAWTAFWVAVGMPNTTRNCIHVTWT